MRTETSEPRGEEIRKDQLVWKHARCNGKNPICVQGRILEGRRLGTGELDAGLLDAGGRMLETGNFRNLVSGSPASRILASSFLEFQSLALQFEPHEAIGNDRPRHMTAHVRRIGGQDRIRLTSAVKKRGVQPLFSC